MNDTLRRNCRCPRAQHTHGTVAAYNDDECRCTACRRARADKSRAYRRVIAHRQWNGSSAWTDATGTRRRLQALSAAGWSLTQLAPHLGMGSSGVGWLRKLHGTCLTVTAAKVRDIYEQLWHVTPTGNAVERTSRWAARRGWAEPWQWQDADIDDPASIPVVKQEALDEIAVERAMHGDPPAHLGKAEHAAAVRLLGAAGLSTEEIGRRLGRSSRSIERARAKARCAA